MRADEAIVKGGCVLHEHQITKQEIANGFHLRFLRLVVER